MKVMRSAGTTKLTAVCNRDPMRTSKRLGKARLRHQCTPGCSNVGPERQALILELMKQCRRPGASLPEARRPPRPAHALVKILKRLRKQRARGGATRELAGLSGPAEGTPRRLPRPALSCAQWWECTACDMPVGQHERGARTGCSTAGRV